MNRSETLVLGCVMAAISLVTWLLTLESPFDGGVFVGLLILGVLIYVGRASSEHGDPKAPGD